MTTFGEWLFWRRWDFIGNKRYKNRHTGVILHLSQLEELYRTKR